MVSLTSPRVMSLLSFIAMFAYLGLVISFGADIPFEGHLISMLVIGSFVFIAASGFASREMKETDGVMNVLELGFLKLIGIFLFSILIAIGYDALVLILAEIFTQQRIINQGIEAFQASSLPISTLFIRIIVGFLVIYPFFQFINLARPGEDSSIPAEYPLESMVEILRELTRSPFIAALIAYIGLYFIPIVGFQFLFASAFDLTLLQTVELAILLWVLILPLIAIGALAGAGFGEDLIRLRMLRKPLRDFRKLGMPKINLRKLQFEIGGAFLVIFAIQAILTTTFFAARNFLVIFDAIPLVASSIPFYILLLTLFNKGRGSFKELNEVWTESGFKVNVFQLFLPVYVFLGVILSSSLEVFVQQAIPAGTLEEIGLNTSILLDLARFVLVLQNFALVITALIVIRRTPASAERRMIKDVPEFYGDDLDGYLYIYGKLKDDQSVENLLRELTRKIRKNPQEADLLKGFLKETLESGDKDVQIAAAETLYTIVERSDKYDQDYFILTQQVLDSEYVGARLYGIKTMRHFLNFFESVEKEQALTYFQLFVGDEDPVVAWDTSLTLQRILFDEPEYRSFVLALMIRSLNSTTNESSLDAIKRFFNKIAHESTEIGQMAISTLGVQLSTGENEHPENLIEGIKSLLRGNSLLAEDLIDQVAVWIQHPDLDFRRNSYLVLTNMAQYGTGREDDILELIITGINDESEEIQSIAFDALTKEVIHAPYLAENIFAIILSRYDDLQGSSRVGALKVIKSIVSIDVGLEEGIVNLVSTPKSTENDDIKSLTLEILGEIAYKLPKFAETAYRAAENLISDPSEKVRQEAITTLGKVVAGQPEMARSVYRVVRDGRNDEAFTVQLAAIEALGYVATATSEFTQEISLGLIPLIDDEDWQVRLAALNALFASVQRRKDLIDELMKANLKAMLDIDRTVRQQSLDITKWLGTNKRGANTETLTHISRNIKQADSEVQTILVNAMDLIVEDQLISVPEVLDNLGYTYDSDNNSLRIASIKTIKTALSKLQQTREISTQAHTALNNSISSLLKAANNSDPSIRKTAYEAITEICAALPEIKVADRGRNAIAKAQRLEKEVDLLDYLETARIRSKRPLDLSTL